MNYVMNRKKNQYKAVFRSTEERKKEFTDLYPEGISFLKLSNEVYSFHVIEYQKDIETLS